MIRYDLEAEDCMGGWASRDVMNERAGGDWVRYDDAAARIAELRKQHATVLVMYHTGQSRIAELEAAIDKLAQVAHPGVQSLAEFKALVEVMNKSLHK